MVKKDINISKFSKLIAFLKKQNVGYKAKKSAIITRSEIIKFLREASNENYLMWKVCLIIGLAGACRREELRKIAMDDIQDKGDMLIITIPETKTGNKRIFTITDEIVEELSALELSRQYLVLRPPHTSHKTFFVNYRQGKCSTQVIGVHTFGKIPSLIAKYLQLPNPNNYTGHCFLVEAGGDILMLKRHGGWKSSTVAEGYVEDCINSKKEISSKIITGRDGASTSFVTTNNVIETENLVNNCKSVTTGSQALSTTSASGMNFSKCTNCTFHISINNK